MLSKWKAGVVVAAASLAISGVGAASAHASASLSVTHISGDEWELDNISDHSISISDIEISGGDLEGEFHGFIFCYGDALQPSGGCSIFMNGSSGSIDVFSGDLPDFEETVDVSS
jgi:hypothetical protein